MKIDFIADTNFLIYLHEGNEIISPFLEYNIGVSFISEIELLGFKKLRNEEETALRKLLEDCFVFGWNRNFKETAIELRKKIFFENSRFNNYCYLNCFQHSIN